MNRWTPIVAATLALLGACAKPAGPAAGTGSAPLAGAAGAPAATFAASPGTGTPPAGGRRPPGAVIPATASALTVQMTLRGLTPVTDKDIFGPVRITDAASVARVADVVNARPVSPLGIHPCPLTAHSGSMELRFTLGDKAETTVDIPLDGCPGIIVEPAGQAPVVLRGGAAQADEVITLLRLDWPRQ